MRLRFVAIVCTAAGGEIFTNADLPFADCGSDGLAEFQWIKGWTGGAGGPDLNDGSNGFGLLVASYFDPQACNGRQPANHARSARTTLPISQPGLAGLEFDSGGTGGGSVRNHVGILALRRAGASHTLGL